MEKFFPEGRRLIPFRIFYGLLFLVLFIFLFHRQLFQYEVYKEQERKQGQRRIIRPGPRGDVLDREGKLLIGNRAHFSAKLHLEAIEKDIWKKKKVLREISLTMRSDLKKNNFITIERLLAYSFNQPHIKRRFIRISGSTHTDENNWKRVTVHFQGNRLTVEQNIKEGTWNCKIPHINPNRAISLEIKNAKEGVLVNIANLFSVKFQMNSKNFLIPATPDLSIHQKTWYDYFFARESSWDRVFSTKSSSLEWESRLGVVQDYTDEVNSLIGRDKIFDLKKLIKHWREKLLLPIELAGDLKPKEYAILVEAIEPNSPIEIQAEAIRHYPFKDLASHVLGYVGSGYEANATDLSGNDLATLEIKGRTGKAGIEKTFDDRLRGKDGGEIWRVNPNGTRYDRIEKKPSIQGKTLQISIDADLQKVAEDSLQDMVSKVSKRRILPDKDWRKTILRRTNQALDGSNEKKVSAELLLSAFIDAPFPLDGLQASTVAGFQGTAKDADQLLSLLYSRGVLAKQTQTENKYDLAPPPLPPGAAVMIHLTTGEILALASKPNYDLSELTPFIPQSVFDRIQRREAWLPRAWHPGYAPASPFKLVTAIAGFSSGNLESNTTLQCDGIHKGMECHVYPGIHGRLDLQNAIAQSCNVYFFKLAEKVGFENLISTAMALGLDKNPNIQIPSPRDKPIVPDPEWKRKQIGVRWTLEDTFNISIGQGGLRQSPLQMACLAAKIATNQALFNPTLIHSKTKKTKLSNALGISKDDLKGIIEGMNMATERGTARRCKINGVSVAGKTGTSQWRNHNMNLNLAWFVGFAPVENPEVAIATLVEGVIPQDQVQGGLTATPIARDLLQAYFDKKNTRLTLNQN